MRNPPRVRIGPHAFVPADGRTSATETVVRRHRYRVFGVTAFATVMLLGAVCAAIIATGAVNPSPNPTADVTVTDPAGVYGEHEALDETNANLFAAAPFKAAGFSALYLAGGGVVVYVLARDGRREAVLELLRAGARRATDQG